MLIRKNSKATELSRRDALRLLSYFGVGAALPFGGMGCQSRTEPAGAKKLSLGAGVQGRPQTLSDPEDARFIIVLAATGGASIIDSFMAVRESENSNAANMNVFPDAVVQDIAGSDFRAVDMDFASLGAIPLPFSTAQSTFVNKHRDDIMVTTMTGTSVNHIIAQKRVISGNQVWNGRTIQECVAEQYGSGFPVPNVNMGFGGYLERGLDGGLPDYAFGEVVPDPGLWPLSLSGSRGILNVPSASRLELARRARDEFESGSEFLDTFGADPKIQRWLESRGVAGPLLEDLDLITNLNVLPDLPPTIPLNDYGLASTPGGDTLRAIFPDFFGDPLEAQACMAYLLLKHRVSCAVTMAPSLNAVVSAGIKNPPLSFDYSHNAHRAAQAFMWDRMLSVADRLIDLLKTEPIGTGGESMWDRTMIFLATDFGRSRNRPTGAPDFGSGHHLNNGVVAISPLVNGNSVLGGVDPNTLLTYGFDPTTGAPDPGREMSESEIFAGLLHAMGVDTSGTGLPDMPAMRTSS